MLNDIESKFPYKKNDTFSFIEPFVGSGAVLFWILNNFPNLKSAVINDINEDLTNSYETIKSKATDLILVLREYENEYHSLSEQTEEKKEYYYDKRNLFNVRESEQTTQTALFF